MGLELKITGSDGKSYKSIEDMIAAEGERVIDDTTSSIETAIRAQTCATHGKRAMVQAHRSGDKFTFDITGCCDDLVEKAQKAADRALAG